MNVEGLSFSGIAIIVSIVLQNHCDGIKNIVDGFGVRAASQIICVGC